MWHNYGSNLGSILQNFTLELPCGAMPRAALRAAAKLIIAAQVCGKLSGWTNSPAGAAARLLRQISSVPVSNQPLVNSVPAASIHQDPAK